ncbi:phosphotransferase family protein [Lachnospiraceae bacterium LCP25S3_G4]
MDYEDRLKDYVKKSHFKEQLEIPKHQDIAYKMLAQGEYNINYVFTHPGNGKNMVLRVNTGSQMHLEHQIEYEYYALKQLEMSKRTPKPFYVDGSRTYMEQGIMVMEFLAGNPLDYTRDLGLAADCLADIHSIKMPGNHVLIAPENLLQAMLDECREMFQVYHSASQGETHIKRRIDRMLDIGQRKIQENHSYGGYRCCINTELNSGNFLINGTNQPNYVIDWEKPIYGDPAQDLGHFLAPTTTFWKTDIVLSKEEMKGFTNQYIKCVGDRFELMNLEERLDLYIPITCLRGITWCAMAWIEYQQPGRLIRNEYTYRKLEAYLSEGFLDAIEKRYF